MGCSSVLQHARQLRIRPRLATRSLWTSNVSSPVQSYISTTTNPRLNLSIEHYLLQQSPPDSHVLFLYTNRPCIVIGRNQNPWLEINLAALHAHSAHDPVELIRRRSGGGAVFHDLGNTNWTVISPPATFTRDKHAGMVVRALRAPPNNARHARINERHDIVLDQVTHSWASEQTVRESAPPDPGDMYRTPWTCIVTPHRPPLKCSGSAYKLTRNRALHHGTCLLNSPNLAAISTLLRSPAKDLITAKGVASVPSPVANIGISRDGFVRNVQRQFELLYGPSSSVEITEDDALAVADLKKGYEELETDEWMFAQTPGFMFSTRPPSQEEQVGSRSPPGLRFWMNVRHGKIEDCKFSIGADEKSRDVAELLKSRSLFGNWTWADVLSQAKLDMGKSELDAVRKWLDGMVPIGKVKVGEQMAMRPKRSREYYRLRAKAQ